MLIQRFKSTRFSHLQVRRPLFLVFLEVFTVMPFQKIAIAGAAGFLGSSILKHLLRIPSVSQITVLTHSTSSTFPSSPILTFVSLPSYNDVAALTAALRGHDLLISALSRLGSDGADEFLVRIFSCLSSLVSMFHKILAHLNFQIN